MKDKKRWGINLLAGIVGTLFAYWVINSWLIAMPFWKYFLIEILLVSMHILYTLATRNQNTQTSENTPQTD